MKLLTRPPETETASEPQAPQDNRRVKARLRLPHGLKSAKFAGAVGLILAAGLVGLLIVNTSLAAGAIKLSGLEGRLARTVEQQQALDVEVEGLSSPAALQVAAAALGMVPATTPAFLDPSTGAVAGALGPAVAPAKPFVPAPQFAATPEEASGEPTETEEAPQPSGASPAPTPSASPTAPADPGPDGAVVINPTPTPTPAPSPAPTGGDSATIVDPEVG